MIFECSTATWPKSGRFFSARDAVTAPVASIESSRITTPVNLAFLAGMGYGGAVPYDAIGTSSWASGAYARSGPVQAVTTARGDAVALTVGPQPELRIQRIDGIDGTVVIVVVTRQRGVAVRRQVPSVIAV
jgi:hypothetical protein